MNSRDCNILGGSPELHLFHNTFCTLVARQGIVGIYYLNGVIILQLIEETNLGIKIMTKYFICNYNILRTYIKLFIFTFKDVFFLLKLFSSLKGSHRVVHKDSLHCDCYSPITYSKYIPIFFAITYLKLMQSSGLELNPPQSRIDCQSTVEGFDQAALVNITLNPYAQL